MNLTLTMLARVTMILVLASKTANSSIALPLGCLQYEPTVVTLNGTLVRKNFPGPPNYESVKKGDKLEIAWLLKLPDAICVDEDKASLGLNSEQSNLLEIQLVLKPSQYSQYKPLVGKRVVASGTLFGQHTAHHRTPVLLIVATLKDATKR